jgi:hypothetical protein
LSPSFFDFFEILPPFLCAEIQECTFEIMNRNLPRWALLSLSTKSILPDRLKNRKIWKNFGKRRISKGKIVPPRSKNARR